MFKRLKNAWKIAKDNDQKSVVDMIAWKQKQLDEAMAAIRENEVSIGDGKAVFFGEPTPEDELEFEREKNGTKPWLDRLKKLI